MPVTVFFVSARVWGGGDFRRRPHELVKMDTVWT